MSFPRSGRPSTRWSMPAVSQATASLSQVPYNLDSVRQRGTNSPPNTSSHTARATPGLCGVEMFPKATRPPGPSSVRAVATSWRTTS